MKIKMEKIDTWENLPDGENSHSTSRPRVDQPDGHIHYRIDGKCPLAFALTAIVLWAELRPLSQFKNCYLLLNAFVIYQICLLPLPAMSYYAFIL